MRVILSFLGLLLLVSPAAAQVVVLRSSIPMQGEYETVLEASADGESREEKSDDEDESSFVLGADVLYPIDETLSWGFSAFYGTNLEIDPEEAPKQELGNDLSLRIIGEMNIPLSPKLDMRIRAEGGLYMLFFDDDLEDYVDGIEENCDSCDIDGSPAMGYVIGGGAGLAFKINPGLVGRIDLIHQYIDLDLLSVESTEGDGEFNLSTSGSRFLLSFGLEFGSAPAVDKAVAQGEGGGAALPAK
ncbi:MAG: hypothetical protein VYD19_11260 [Myxococcota bacterium]|nr:hypothetical protein [Myxococcota bacterium]